MRIFRSLARLLLLAVLLAACSPQQPAPTTTPAPTPTAAPPTPMPSPTAGISPEARAYLEEFLQIVEQNALNAGKVDWEALRAELYAREAEAVTPEDTHDSLLYVLIQLDDGHSRLMFPDENAEFLDLTLDDMPQPWGEVVSEQYAYLNIPSFASGDEIVNQDYADRLQALAAELQAADPCGWVVDLRPNSGGNMGPMLAGVGALLGEGDLGSFQDAAGERKEMAFQDGRVTIGDELLTELTEPGETFQPHDLPLAVLIGPNTASAGEMLALAFLARPNVVFFGHTTNGLTTANNYFTLSDGTGLLLTVEVFVDVNGELYGGAMEPDLPLSGMFSDWDTIPPEVLDWLREQTACREGSS